MIIYIDDSKIKSIIRKYFEEKENINIKSNYDIDFFVKGTGVLSANMVAEAIKENK